MLSFSKLKAIMFIACALVAIAFFLACIAMIAQNQPVNIIFICLISSILALGFALVLALDVKRESKTMKVIVTIQDGLPIDIVSADMDEVNIKNFKNKIDHKRLSNRELTAHIIHYYEQRKILNIIKPDTQLQIKFNDLPLVTEITEIEVEGVAQDHEEDMRTVRENT